MADASMFTANSDCESCNHLIYFDPNSATGASATPPCLIWSNPECPQGFSITAENFGTCRLQVYARTINNTNGGPWGELAAPIALLNTDGTQVFTEDDMPITARPFQPIGFIDQNNFEITQLNPVYTALGVLCVQTSSNVCPICSVRLKLVLSSGEESLYEIGNRLTSSSRSNSSMGTTIRGTVDCRDSTETINTTNLRARLISCPECATDQPTVFSTVPLQVSTNMTNNTEATYEFKNIRNISCFRVEIICVAPNATNNGSTSGNSTASGRLVLNTRSQANLLTSRNVLATSECKLINGQNLFTVPPLLINCDACQDTLVTVTGTVVCRGTGTTTLTDNVTVQFIPCETKNSGGSVDIKCGTSGTSACGSPLMVTPTYQAPLNTNGTFSASIAIGCYLIRFVCTSSPTTILTIASPSSLITGTGCNYYCLSTTNLGTITLTNCSTCPVTQVAISGNVVCSSSGTVSGLQENMTAQLISCNSMCTSLASPLNIVATDEINVTTGLYDFGSVDAGCYQIRIVCSSCTSDSTIVGTIPCTNYGQLVNRVPTIAVDCVTCSTVSLSGTVTCESGSSGLTNVRLQITQYQNGCDTSEGKTISFITPNTSTGIYSICLPIGIGYTIQAICSSTGTALTTATACTIISTDSIVDIDITDCGCTTVTTSSTTLISPGASIFSNSVQKIATNTNTNTNNNTNTKPAKIITKPNSSMKPNKTLPLPISIPITQTQVQAQVPPRNIKLSTMSVKHENNINKNESENENSSGNISNGITDSIQEEQNDNDNDDQSQFKEEQEEEEEEESIEVDSTATLTSTYGTIEGIIDNVKEKCIIVVRLSSNSSDQRDDHDRQAHIYIPKPVKIDESEESTSSVTSWEWTGQVIKNEVYRIECMLNKSDSPLHMTLVASLLTRIEEDETQILMSIN